MGSHIHSHYLLFKMEEYLHFGGLISKTARQIPSLVLPHSYVSPEVPENAHLSAAMTCGRH